MKVKVTFYIKDKIKEGTGFLKIIGLSQKVVLDKKIGKTKSIDVLKLRSFELCY